MLLDLYTLLNSAAQPLSSKTVTKADRTIFFIVWKFRCKITHISNNCKARDAFFS